MGMARGVTAVDTGAAISVPVGRATLGRLFNVMGEPLDSLGEVAFVVSPNKIHHLSIGDYIDAYPRAQAFASPGLLERQDEPPSNCAC